MHNVLFNQALSVLAVGVFDKLNERKAFCISVILLFALFATLTDIDHEWRDVLMIVLFYILHRNRAYKILLTFLLMMNYGITGAFFVSAVLYRSGLELICSRGTEIKAFVCDGHAGLLASITECSVQMCLFHMLQIVRCKLTSNPRLICGRELLAFAAICS